MFRERYGSKYGNRRQTYEGITYHSNKEADYAAELDLRKKAGDIKSWERQVKISLDVKKKHIANYYVDFMIHHNDKTKEYVEVKGFATEVWRLKWLLFEALYSNKRNVRLSVIR